MRLRSSKLHASSVHHKHRQGASYLSASIRTLILLYSFCFADYLGKIDLSDFGYLVRSASALFIDLASDKAAYPSFLLFFFRLLTALMLASSVRCSRSCSNRVPSYSSFRIHANMYVIPKWKNRETSARDLPRGEDRARRI